MKLTKEQSLYYIVRVLTCQNKNIAPDDLQPALEEISKSYGKYRSEKGSFSDAAIQSYVDWLKNFLQNSSLEVPDVVKDGMNSQTLKFEQFILNCPISSTFFIKLNNADYKIDRLDFGDDKPLTVFCKPYVDELNKEIDISYIYYRSMRYTSVFERDILFSIDGKNYLYELLCHSQFKGESVVGIYLKEQNEV